MTRHSVVAPTDCHGYRTWVRHRSWARRRSVLTESQCHGHTSWVQHMSWAQRHGHRTWARVHSSLTESQSHGAPVRSLLLYRWGSPLMIYPGDVQWLLQWFRTASPSNYRLGHAT